VDGRLRVPSQRRRLRPGAIAQPAAPERHRKQVEQASCARWYSTEVKSLLTSRKSERGRNAAVRSRWLAARHLVAAALLLSQFQLLCLTAFHHHDLTSRSQPATSASVGTPDGRGAPLDESRSCPVCQLLRHNPTPPPTSVHLSAESLCSSRISPLSSAKPLVASSVRLTGRDPPNSFEAS
jgi:hypothetical protein